jgi:long-chain acyl-CoA synthetase
MEARPRAAPGGRHTRGPGMARPGRMDYSVRALVRGLSVIGGRVQEGRRFYGERGGHGVDVTGSCALWDALRGRTGGLGGVAAVSARDGDLTFEGLWTDADRLARRLSAAGIREGDVTALALPNGSRFVRTFLALCRLDATVAIIPYGYGPAELRPVLAETGVTCVVTDSQVAARVATAVPIQGSTTVDELTLAFLRPTGDGLQPTGDRAVPDDTAILKFSSGSMAEPKGIALSAANLLAEAENVATTFGLSPGARVLAAVPIAHSYGFDLGVLQTLWAGTTLVLHDGFVPRHVLAALGDGDVSMFLGVPAQYRILLSTPMSTPPSLDRIAWLLSCTAPLVPETIESFHDRFGGLITQHYGASETGAVTNHVPSDVLRKPASVGRPMSGVRVTIRDPDGAPMPAGAEGEVVVTSAAVARGYVIGAPTISPFRDGGFWMGDLGRLDEAGFLTISGRRDSIINVGGLKVSPAEVVAVLERHPAVREAAVVGVPDGSGEEVVCAAVVLAAPADEAGLLAFCRASLAEHKVPRRIQVRDELPHTAGGKVRLRPEDVAI